MMEKRVLLAALLSVIFLSWYSGLVMKWAGPQDRRTGPPVSQQPVGESLRPGAPQQREERLDPLKQEAVASIESEDLRLEIGRTSAAIRWATLKRFTENSGTNPLRFGGKEPLLLVRVGEEPLSFHVVKEFPSSVTLKATDTQQNDYHISYTINHSNIIVTIELHKNNGEQNSQEAMVSFLSGWSRGDNLKNSQNLLEAYMLHKGARGNPVHKKYAAPFKTGKIVPRGTLLVSLTERYFCQSMKPEGAVSSRPLPSPNGTIAVASEAMLRRSSDLTQRYSATLYIGPRDYFHLKKAGFEEAFPIGVLGQVGLIMLVFLNWIAGITKSYGVAILLFSGLVTLSMSPLTLMSMKSMKNMQALKPKADKILAQHKDDKMKANKEIFTLYREHKVSPLSGCLPMLLQMPIFIALFQAMSHFIELRGRPFLWVKDLSLPDRLAQLPFSLPLIGSDFNLLPIIMAAAMYLQTRASQSSTAGSAAVDNPAARMMSGPLMPLLFCLMFYTFPAGLVLYWLTNTLISLAFYRLVK